MKQELKGKVQGGHLTQPNQITTGYYSFSTSVEAPLLPKIARSTSSCGSDYLVCAMEYIPQDQIDTFEHVWKFSTSLNAAVYQLHFTAELLHCDFKPDNIWWSNGAVKLIDFMHAQPIHQTQRETIVHLGFTAISSPRQSARGIHISSIQHWGQKTLDPH